MEEGLSLVDIKPIKRSLNKEFLYFVAFVTSAIFIVFLIGIGSISDSLAEQFSQTLSLIPFVDLKISKQLISDLHFPNPVTSSLLAGNVIFLGFAFFDLFRHEEIRHDGSKDLFKESSSVSYVIHILILMMVLFSLLLSLHPRPRVKVSRIEFIPPQIESKKKPPPTQKRSQKNSIDQGKHDPKKPIKPPEKAPGKPQLPPKTQQTVKPAEEPKPAPKPKTSPQSTKQESKPLPSLPLPLPRNIAPQPKISKEGINLANKADLKPSPLPRLMDYTPNSNSYGSASSGTPSPKTSDGVVGGTGSSEVIARLSSIPRAPDSLGGAGAGGADGADGNPGPNNYPDRAPSLASQADVNFGPYMSALQRKIKRMWKPPRGSESNRIVVTFSIGTDGKLTNLKLVRASELPDANVAALDAVTKAAPFDPLPPGSGPSVDIEFTFDYNVFQRTRW